MLKVVCYNDFGVLCMSVMWFQKKFVWVGGESSIQFYFGFFEFCFTLQSPLGERSWPDG